MLTVTRIAVSASIISCVVALSGCATNRVNLVEAGQVQLAVHQGRSARLSGVTVYQAKDEVRVSGYARNRASCFESLRGSIEVLVLGLQGEILKQQTVQLIPERVSRNAPSGTFFHAYIPGTLPPGAHVEVRYQASDPA